MMEKYFEKIEEEVKKCYKVANRAKKIGIDPEKKVDIPLAKNMSERVVGLVGAVAPQIKDTKIIERISELEKEYGMLDWRVALTIALETAQSKFCSFNDEKEAMEVGIRLGIAYITVGVVASPLEGFVELKIKNRRDNGRYFCLMYSGPIRSAGGTGAAVSVLIADYVRKKMGYDEYDISEDEANRSVTEVFDYHERAINLQYVPSREELMFLVRNLPVEISGDPSEKMEVSNYKDLPRIETNRIRNGVALVLAECLAQKAPKINRQLEKWGKEFDLKHWNFLEKFLKIQSKEKAKEEKEEDDVKIKPDYTYIKDLVAGRPILTHPLRKGGFRLRYGRCRNSGFSSCALHPATMGVLKDFIAIGTQLKLERPSKGTVIASCDTIEGPLVKLKDGSVLRLNSLEEARKVENEIEEILFLGDILVNYGDFFNRAHKLVPAGYNEEWYKQELRKAGCKIKDIDVSAEEAIKIANMFGVYMHPKYTYHWKDIDKEQLLSLLKWVQKGSIEKNIIRLPFIYDLESDVKNRDPKRVLELIGVPHKIAGDNVVIEEGHSIALCANIGLLNNDIENIIKDVNDIEEETLDIINEISDVKIRDKSGTYIGARMGRPEKAKMRKMKGSPQVLFPVGEEGGRMRSLTAAVAKGTVNAEFPTYHCKHCDKGTIYPVCVDCWKETRQLYYSKMLDKVEKEKHADTVGYKLQQVDVNGYFNKAVKKLKIKDVPEMIKGIRGTSNKEHIPENLMKGILRAKHNLYVNKDGTIRYDMTETTLTAFKPKEIGASIEKLKELGYDKDIYGEELKDKEQIVELKPQDIILPKVSGEENASKIMFRITQFIDELLVKVYEKEPFYNLKDEQDIIGHMAVALSPHTSAGVVARIIGFSKINGLVAHPLFHCLMRRDCDGDEACVMLLMDCLLNFSKKFLPGNRGAVQDSPLVLTSKIIPTEVDDMVFDMDVVYEYPIELYEAAMEYKNPWEVKIEQLNSRLGTPKQYFDYGFTHDTSDTSNGVRRSAYKSLPTMADKLKGQMELADKIRAVDESDVAKLVIEKHFIRDIRGNLRKFSMQQFRCVSCNEKFRRPPLKGKCGCGGRIIFTIAEGTIVKYLEPCLQLAEKYNIPNYLKQSVDLTRERIEGVFGKDKDKQEGLGKWV